MKRGIKENRLIPDKIVFPPTYINSVSKTAFKILNDDPDHFRYEWRRFSSEDEENKILLSFDPLDPTGRESSSSILLFNSPIFKIYPIRGDIWGNSSNQSIVEFHPTSSTIQTEVAYLLNLDTGQRISYSFQGEGLAPLASFNVQQINLGHISLEGIYEYKIILRNTGLIPFDFQLIEKTLSFPIINFSPTKGKLNAGESIPIHFILQANHVGQFNETFLYKISDLNDQLCPTITVFGRVIGPTFNLSKHSLDFGTVSYGFLYSDEIEIENTSEIPFDYCFRLSNDTTFSLRELKIIPETGTVSKHSKKTVKFEFIPTSIQNYAVNLNLCSDKFSEQLMTIPMTAKCICPDVSIVNPKANLGQLFLNYKYHFKVVLRNISNYPAKFEFVECDDMSNLDAIVQPLKYLGEVNPKSESEFPFSIQPLHLGHMDFTRFIRVFGSDDSPLKFDFTCLCVGPKIVISTEKIEFGHIDILNETNSVFQIKNDSLIQASFVAEIESKTDVFSLKMNSGTIEPGETLDFLVAAYLDDSIDFNGKLVFNFDHLTPIELNIHAKGRGNGLLASIDLNEIDMNYAFTDVPVYKKFELTNVTHRVHEIKWNPGRPEIVSKSGINSFFQFRIDPETCVIQPKQTVEVSFIFSCKNSCTFSLQPKCEVTVGKKKFDLYKPKIQGEFVRPSVEFERESFSFEYIHNTKKEEELTGRLDSREIISPSKELLQPIAYSNSIKNTSKLPLIIMADVNPPFFVSTEQMYLDPNTSTSFEVIFDPSFKKDFTSQKIDGKITFSLDNNPQQYFIDLHASLVFPNLSLSPSKICFGSLLKSTEDNKIVHITNISSIPVSFFWELLPKKKETDIAKLFDIYPIRGDLEVGESQDIHISFFALDRDDENFFDGIAVCHVIGGPDYTIDLNGSSSAIEYQLGPKTIDFGTCYLAENLQSKVSLTNASDISLQYEIKMPKSLSMAFLSVEPTKGSLEVGQTQVFNLSVIPGYPSKMKDCFLIQIGKVVDEEISICVDAAFPQIETTFKRSQDDEANKIFSSLPTTTESNESENFIEIENKIMNERLKEISGQPSFMNQLMKMTMMDFSKIKKFNEFVLSRFEIDFGSMTLGETRSFKYDIRNVSPFPISFEFMTNSLIGTGFSIEPTTFVDVPPDANLEIFVKFDEEQRTVQFSEPEFYDVPILFSEDLASILTVKASISMPMLEILPDHFDFETTLVGQRRTITVQFINQNMIPLQFSIDDTKQVFTASPNSGVLSPISYRDIEITFAPNKNGDYSISLPIIIKHNSESQLINLTGKGVELKLKLDPLEHDFAPLQPFDEPITFDAEICNPTDFPIEVLLPQWDLEIENEILNRKHKESQKVENSQDEVSPLAPTQEMSPLSTMLSTISAEKVKRFSFCIIVNGPSKSGKSIVSKLVSDIFGGLPIISLKELWMDLIEFNVTDPEEYITTFHNLISGDDYARGFVIDGLNAIPDPPEVDSLILAQMKQKHVAESLNKNPFLETQGDIKVSLETVANYIIHGLDGQFVFQIALQATPEAIEKNQQLFQKETEKLNENKINEEIIKLLSMNEEDYLKLPEEDQRNIDQKRIEYRKKFLQEQGIDLQALLESMKENEKITSTLKSTRKSLLASARRMSALKSTSSIKSNKVTPKKSQNQKNAFQASDADRLSILSFTFTLGRIAKKIENETEAFQAIDPVLMADKSASSALRQSCNSLLVDSLNDIETIEQQIRDFIPNMNEIKDKVLPKFRHEPTLFIPKYCSQEGIEHLPSIKQFKIVNKEKPGNFPIFEKVQTSPKSRNTSSRNSSLSRRRASRIMIDRSLTENLNEMNYTKRYNLDPGQSEKITIMYSSEEIGIFEEAIVFSIDNIEQNTFNLQLTAHCLYPDVDKKPESVFEKVVQRLTNRTEFAFVSELNEFHFGPLLVAKERIKNQPFQYRQPMKFYNPSPFDVEISAVWAVAAHAWGIEGSPAIIQSGQSKEINVCFHPGNQDTFKNTLKFFIKDNPEPFSFTFVAEAFLPSVELSTTTLDFEKILIKQVKKMEIEIINTNRIPAIWRLNKPNQLSGLFTFNKTEGNIPPKKAEKLEVTYTSTKCQVVKKQLQIDILDGTKQKTYQSYKIQLNAETFDVNFDFLYPKGIDHLVIGTVRASQSKSIVCTLKNKGKYISNFNFSFVKKIYSNAVTIEPSSGTISPSDKPINITFTFCSKKVFHLNQETICYLTVSDSMSGTEMAKIGIPMSVDSFYSQYIYDPKEPIEFGDLTTGKSLKKEFTIANTGCFPFDFELIPKIDVSEPPSPSDAQSRKGRRYTVNKLPTNSRGKKGKISIGCFTVSHGEGTIQPGGKEIIVVELSSHEARKAHNIVILKISDVPEKDPAFNGIELHFKGDVFAPGIEINNFKSIFPHQNICLRDDIVKNDVTSFFEDEQTFHFKPEILGEKKSVDIVLHNVNPIPCTIDASVKLGNTKKRSSFSFPFKLSNEVIELQPLSKSTIQLFFNPTVVGNFSAVFKAEVRGGNEPETKLLKFDVEGVGALPIITLLNYDVKPLSASKTSDSIKNKNPTLKPTPSSTTTNVSSSSINNGNDQTSIAIKNSIARLTSQHSNRVPLTKINSNSNIKPGKLSSNKLQTAVSTNKITPPQRPPNYSSNINTAKAMNEALISFGKTLIHTNKIKHISLKNTGVIPARISISEVHSSEFSIENVDISKVFDIQPDRIFDIAVLFAPLKAGQSEFQIMITVLNNPASSIKLNISGQGSDEDVIFEGIPGDNNHLVFKDTCVKRNQALSFTMRNVSESDFRFAWIENNDFHFTPRTGHLRKKKSKLIKVNFYAEKPITYESLIFNCQWIKIELQDKDAPDWDDSMTIVRFVERDNLLPRVDIAPPPQDEKTKSGRRTTTFKKSNLRRSSSVRRAKLRKSGGNTTSQPNLQPVVTQVNKDLVKVIEVKNEPLYSQLPEKCPDIPLTISAVCDFIRYELSENSITFAPTMMFETRVVEVTLRNTCNICFEYGWRTLQFTSHQGNYSKTHRSPFSVLPKTGVIESGKSTVFKVCFTPEEVDDFSAILQCEIPFLSQMEPPRIDVSGFSRRPLCHFNVNLSDYISAGRRHSDYNYPLPDDVRVLELFSSGIGKKTFKKFEIVNTTSHPYEIVWTKNQEHSNDSIVCETTRSFISSGTGFSVSFSFLPKSVKTVESLWNFAIPEHQVQIPFLIVGRIMHK